MDDTRVWIQVVSSDCIVLQNRVDVELAGVAGVQWIGHRSGSPVPRSDCIDDVPGYFDIASEWGVGLTRRLKLAWIAVPTAEYG